MLTKPQDEMSLIKLQININLFVGPVVKCSKVFLNSCT